MNVCFSSRLKVLQTFFSKWSEYRFTKLQSDTGVHEHNKPKVLFLCTYYVERYSRNDIIVRGLEANGFQILRCVSSGKSPLRYVKALVKFARNVRSADIVFIGFRGHEIVPLVRLVTDKPIVFDAFFSIYDTLCNDRAVFRANSIIGWLLFLVDRISCLSSDLVLLDTEEHIKYFVTKFNLPRNIFARIPIGADDTVFYPSRTARQRKEGKHIFSILFHGTFIPLQGVDYIVRAAENLGNWLHFTFVGSGQTYRQIVTLAERMRLSNATFVGRVSYESVPKWIAQSDLCLGIFGDSEKAGRVIPNKVYEAMAMKKPIVTSRTRATSELLAHCRNAFLCEPANPESIVNAIEVLSDSPYLRHRISAGAYLTYRTKSCPIKIGRLLRKHLASCLKRET